MYRGVESEMGGSHVFTFFEHPGLKRSAIGDYFDCRGGIHSQCDVVIDCIWDKKFSEGKKRYFVWSSGMNENEKPIGRKEVLMASSSR